MTASEAAMQARIAERNELKRIAAQRLIDHRAAGRKVDPHALEWAQRIVARFKPIGWVLGDGEPVARVAEGA